MNNRIISLLFGFALLTIAISGCATNTNTMEYYYQTIESDSIQAIVDDPSGSKLPLDRGNTIIITTKEKIKISSRNVNWVRMVLDDANTSRVKGRVENASGDEGYGYDDVAGIIVEINLDNIEEIEEWRKRTYDAGSSEWDAEFWGELFGWVTAIVYWSK